MPEKHRTVRAGRGRQPGVGTVHTSVQVLDRALRLLGVVAGRDGASLSEIAVEAGMAPSTTHRLLTSLAGHGMVAADPDTGAWTIGVRAFEIGNGFLRHRKLGEIARPVLKALMGESGETANLAIEENGEVVFVAQAESHAPMRAFFRPGQRGPLHASGIGKAILSTWPDAEIGRVLGGGAPKRFTERTLADLPSLIADLQTTRARGWSVDDEEHTVGMRCIAAPVFDEFGEAVAGVSVSGPAVRLTLERTAQLGPRVRGAAERVTSALGGRVPGGA